MGRKISGERGQSPLVRSALIFSKSEKKAEVSAGEVKVVLHHVTDTPVDTSMYLTNPAVEAGVGSLGSIDTQRLRLCGVANS